jgi:intracellular septation protein
MNLIFEFLPLILFLAAFLYKGIYVAIIVLMVAMPIGVFFKYVRTKSFDKMYFWSTVLLLIGGSLTLYYRNPLFLYWKPTVFYWLVAGAFLSSQFFGDTTLVQRFFGLVDGLSFDKITPAQWKKLNIVWVFFFIGAGILNIYVAYNYEQATWVKFKVFGLTALTFIFMLGQTLWFAKLIDFEKTSEREDLD